MEKCFHAMSLLGQQSKNLEKQSSPEQLWCAKLEKTKSSGRKREYVHLQRVRREKPFSLFKRETRRRELKRSSAIDPTETNVPLL
jgi:hypothetical protein